MGIRTAELRASTSHVNVYLGPVLKLSTVSSTNYVATVVKIAVIDFFFYRSYI